VSFGASLLVRSYSNLSRLLRRQTLRSHRGQERDPLPSDQPLHRRTSPSPEGARFRTRRSTRRSRRAGREGRDRQGLQELRKPAEYFSDIKKTKVDEDSLELAETLIKKRTAKFDPSKFSDGYEVALKELVEAKVKHLPIPKDEEPVAPSKGKVISLMDALRKSVQNTETAPAVARKKPTEETLFPEQEEHAGPTLVKSTGKASRTASAKAAKGAAKRKSA
jgi:hypothetical protein